MATTARTASLTFPSLRLGMAKFSWQCGPSASIHSITRFARATSMGQRPKTCRASAVSPGAGAVFDRTQAPAQVQQTQSDFAHTNRVSMMGEFAASLSHEITQSIASARNNARAALNFLDQQPPDLGEVKEALGCVVADAYRAGDIVGRI